MSSLESIGGTAEARSIGARLAEPFEVDFVQYKPSVVSGNRALAQWYIDARAVMDRLDRVVGPTGWQDSYEVLAGGCVICHLKVRFGADGWVDKEDVGGPSGQPDPGDKMKAAFSDAFKRAAVKFGIGRYLYDIEPMWFDYDPQKKKFAKPPVLPAKYLPGTAPKTTLAEPKIAPPQVTELRKLFSERQASLHDALAYYVIERLEDLPQSKFAGLKKVLTEKPLRVEVAAN